MRGLSRDLFLNIGILFISLERIQL